LTADQLREKEAELAEAQAEIALLRQQLQERDQKILDYQTRIERMTRDANASRASPAASTSAAPSTSAAAAQDGKKAATKRRGLNFL
jgi:TolA-binding protein